MPGVPVGRRWGHGSTSLVKASVGALIIRTEFWGFLIRIITPNPVLIMKAPILVDRASGPAQLSLLLGPFLLELRINPKPLKPQTLNPKLPELPKLPKP